MSDTYVLRKCPYCGKSDFCSIGIATRVITCANGHCRKTWKGRFKRDEIPTRPKTRADSGQVYRYFLCYSRDRFDDDPDDDASYNTSEEAYRAAAEYLAANPWEKSVKVIRADYKLKFDRWMNDGEVKRGPDESYVHIDRISKAKGTAVTVS